MRLGCDRGTAMTCKETLHGDSPIKNCFLLVYHEGLNIPLLLPWTTSGPLPSCSSPPSRLRVFDVAVSGWWWWWIGWLGGGGLSGGLAGGWAVLLLDGARECCEDSSSQAPVRPAPPRLSGEQDGARLAILQWAQHCHNAGSATQQRKLEGEQQQWDGTGGGLPTQRQRTRREGQGREGGP